MHSFGVHESISKGIVKAIHAAKDRGNSTLQIFQKQNRGYWFHKDFDKNNESVKETLEETGTTLVVHAGYLVNLVSQKVDVRKISLSSLIQELDKASYLGAKYLVLHPGSVGAKGDKDEGFTELVDVLSLVLDGDAFSTKLLIETMPGGGGQLGGDLEVFAEAYETLSKRVRIGICFDTCHSHVAGYDFTVSKEDYENFWNLWDEYLGIKNLDLFHVNGAFHDYCSKRDGHASLDGLLSANPKKFREIPSINPEFFSWLVKDPRFPEIPGILETPVHNWNNDLEYIRALSK